MLHSTTLLSHYNKLSLIVSRYWTIWFFDECSEKKWKNSLGQLIISFLFTHYYNVYFIFFYHSFSYSVFFLRVARNFSRLKKSFVDFSLCLCQLHLLLILRPFAFFSYKSLAPSYNLHNQEFWRLLLQTPII